METQHTPISTVINHHLIGKPQTSHYLCVVEVSSYQGRGQISGTGVISSYSVDIIQANGGSSITFTQVLPPIADLKAMN